MLVSIIVWSFILTGLSVWLKPYLLRFIWLCEKLPMCFLI
jgi:hypothetical protein